MEKFQKAVKEFMRAGGQETPDSPVCKVEIKKFRESLIEEELGELKCANTILDVMDAIGDLLYVVIGSAVAFGIDIEPVFDEIHRSNMTKVVDGKLLKNRDGKIMKPDTYEEPNLSLILVKQLYMRSENDNTK